MTREEIGRIIKESRIAAGLTQLQAAEALGRPQQTIAAWENGRSQPDANTLFDLFRVLGRSVDEAFGFTMESAPLSGEALMIARAYEELKPWGRKRVRDEVEKQTAQQSSLARNMKEYREHKGLTQKKLAEVTGIPLSAIREFESEYGGRFICEGELALIAVALEIPPELLLGSDVTYEKMCNMMDQNYRWRLDEILEQLNPSGLKKATDIVKRLEQNPRYLVDQEISANLMEESSALDSAYARLNLIGHQKAVEGVDALAKKSAYRRQKIAGDAPTTSSLQESKDTPHAAEGTETPREGE